MTPFSFGFKKSKICLCYYAVSGKFGWTFSHLVPVLHLTRLLGWKISFRTGSWLFHHKEKALSKVFGGNCPLLRSLMMRSGDYLVVLYKKWPYRWCLKCNFKYSTTLFKNIFVWEWCNIRCLFIPVSMGLFVVKRIEHQFFWAFPSVESVTMFCVWKRFWNRKNNEFYFFYIVYCF